MKKSFGFILTLLVWSNFAFGQDNLPFTLNYIPPSPNVAALGKFGDIPVSEFTGVPNISIPIYNYAGSANDLSLSISLNYHAGGVRVEEIASNVGLGWALNAGGAISRTVRGLPDDYPSYGYIDLGTSQNPVDLSVLDAYTKNVFDGEQDVFSFNFSGNSGKFILDGQGKPIVITDSKIQILVTRISTIQQFVITDEGGIKYYFSDNEQTTSEFGSLRGGITYTSSWYLSKIVNPFVKDSITFAYESFSSHYVSMNNETRVNLYLGPATINPAPISAVTSSSIYNTLSKRIKAINLPNDVTLSFKYSPIGRCDLIGDNSLDSVNIVNNISKWKSSFKLFHSYIGLTGVTNYSPAPCNLNGGYSSTSVRLRLDSVKEASGVLSKPAYVFSYYDSYFLPDRTSVQQDNWGFANNNRQTTLVPEYLSYDIHSNKYTYLSGADRTPDSTKVKASSLIKIKYPTGGTTTFDYEVNRAGDNKLVKSKWITQTVTAVNMTQDEPKIFTVNRDNTAAEMEFNFQLSSWCSNNNVTSCYFLFSVTNLSETITYGSAQFNYADLGSTKQAVFNGFPNGTYKLKYSTSCDCEDYIRFNLFWQQTQPDSAQLAGGLRIRKITTYDGVDHTKDIVKTFKYVLPDGRSSGTVGSSNSYFFNSWKPTQINDTYTLAVNSLTRTTTTNTPMAYAQGAPVAYTRVETTVKNGGAGTGKSVDFFSGFNDRSYYKADTTRTALLIALSNSTDENHSYGSFHSICLSAYYNLSSTWPPFPPGQVADWRLGNHLKTEVYDATGQLLQRTSSSYAYDSVKRSDLKNVKVARFDESLFTVSSYSKIFYNWYTGRGLKSSTRDVTYSSPTDSLVLMTNYSYDTNYYVLKKSSTSRSVGDTLETRLYYPFDYDTTVTALSGFGAMWKANMIHKPVSSETWLLNGTQKMLNGYVLDYMDSSMLIKPHRYYSLTASVPLSQSTIGAFNSTSLLRMPSLYHNDVTFVKYDGKGNPLELLYKGNRKSYLWDYKNSSAIAEVTNAGNNDIAYTSFEADGSGNWSIPSAARSSSGYTGFQSFDLANGNITKGGLSTAQTYLVSFWSQTSNITVNGTAATTGTTANGWTYYEATVSGISAVTISHGGTSALIDELRLLPKNAQMTTYTYDPGKGVKSISDANNQVGFFEYDDLGRLQTVRDKNNKILKSYAYNYTTSLVHGDMNSVTSNAVMVDNITDLSMLSTLTADQLSQSTGYLDGLGRPIQNVAKQASPLKKDIVTPVVYDALGREYRKYLPVAVENNGLYKSGLLDANGNYSGAALNYYNNPSDKIADDASPFSETVFEPSPLNRVAKQGAPGASWQPDGDINSTSDHTVKHHYEVNGATDVILFTYDPASGLVSTGTSGQPSYYGAGQLSVKRTTDEHQNDVIEYADKLGHTVCKKVQYKTDSSGNKLYASTYYIYDDMGNLVVVLQPEAIKSALNSITSQN